MPCLLVCFLAIASTTRPMLWSPHTISYDTKPRGFIPYTTYAIQYSTVQYTQRHMRQNEGFPPKWFRVGRWTDVSSSGLHKPCRPFFEKALVFAILDFARFLRAEKDRETKRDQESTSCCCCSCLAPTDDKAFHSHHHCRLRYLIHLPFCCPERPTGAFFPHSHIHTEK